MLAPQFARVPAAAGVGDHVDLLVHALGVIGDVVVQQATNHAWVNRSKEVCRIAFNLMDSQKP